MPTPTSAPPGGVDSSSQGIPGPSSRFSQYLTNLTQRPAPDPLLEYLDSDIAHMSTANSRPLSQHLSGSASNGNELANPESDSYGYIEMLLESLFVLGRLGAGLDAVTQKVAGEIHGLVEATLDEVEER